MSTKEEAPYTMDRLQLLTTYLQLRVGKERGIKELKQLLHAIADDAHNAIADLNYGRIPSRISGLANSVADVHTRVARLEALREVADLTGVKL